MNDVFSGPIGLIVNPRSQRNRERLERLRAVYRPAKELIGREIERVEDIPSVLDEFSAAGATLLAVSGGDGTIQATMTALVARNPFPSPPPLAVLAGGMTNVTGRHLGISGKPDQGLAALLRRRRVGGTMILQRHPLLSVRARRMANRNTAFCLAVRRFMTRHN
ncbi:MAG: diacylglycerol kinase family protein [Dongiaceae bacterium]